MLVICEVTLDAYPKEEEPLGAPQKPTSPTLEVGLPPPPEVIMRREPFPMPPSAPQLVVQNSTQPRSVEQWQGHVSAANPHLLRFSLICPRLTTFWSFSLLRQNRCLAAQSQDQTYIFLICRI